jgi:uncharacterized protein YggE
MDSKSEDIRTITVTGEAVVVPKPDVAYVNLFVRSDGTLLQDALRENGAIADQVRQALLEAYPEIRDIEIQDVFMGESRTVSLGDNKANVGRPEVLRSFLVTIPPDQVLGIAIADKAIRLGCLMRNPLPFLGGLNPQGAIMFGLVEPANAKDDALKQAIDNAKDKAQRLAGFMGKNIGAIEQVSVLEVPGSFEMMRHSRHAAWSRIRYLSNSPNGIEISAKISVTFKLAD